MTGYFVDCTTVAEARERYRSLAKTYHPDAGGDTETMQAINMEWGALSKSLPADPESLRVEHPFPAREVIREQQHRMFNAMLESARQLCPDAHVYTRGNSYDWHICIDVPAQHAARETLRTAGYRRHSAWRCWRRHGHTFPEWAAMITWLRGERDAPFADVAELEVAA
jgi:hypothetical protein